MAAILRTCVVIAFSLAALYGCLLATYRLGWTKQDPNDAAQQLIREARQALSSRSG